MVWMGEQSALEKISHLAGHYLRGIGASEINEKGGKSLTGIPDLQSGALRPLKLAVLRQLMG